MFHYRAFLKKISEVFDNSPSLKHGDSPTYTLRGFRVWSSCFPVATNVSTPQADTECPSANMMYSNLRYKKQEKFAPYIPIAKARGFTALSGKLILRMLTYIIQMIIMIYLSLMRYLLYLNLGKMIHFQSQS